MTVAGPVGTTTVASVCPAAFKAVDQALAPALVAHDIAARYVAFATTALADAVFIVAELPVESILARPLLSDDDNCIPIKLLASAPRISNKNRFVPTGPTSVHS